MQSAVKQIGSSMILAAAFCACPAWAQDPAVPPPPPPSQADGAPPFGGPRHGGPERRVEMLQHALDLTPDQTTQVKALFAAEREKMEALRSNTALAPAERHAQGMAIHEGTQTRIHALLTPEQATKYDAMEARMRDRRHAEEPPAPPPGV